MDFLSELDAAPLSDAEKRVLAEAIRLSEGARAEGEAEGEDEGVMVLDE